MSRWGELIPHDEDNESCLCGCRDEEPTAVDALYLDAEHFALTAQSGPPLEPRARVVPTGRPYPGLVPRAGTDGHCRPGRCLGLTCCSYECSQGRCPSVPASEEQL